MAATVTVNSITTADAAITTAPHKISAKAGKNQATVNFTLRADNPPTLYRAWRVLVGGTNRVTGRVAGHRGGVCGIARCGSFMPTAIPRGTVINEAITYVEANDGGADGARTVNIYGWSDEGVVA